MKICTVDELVNQNFNVVFVNALKQFWHNTKYFQCIGAPKRQNLFLFLNGCRITYTDKNKRTVVANSGDLVYTPIGSEYRAQLSDFQSPDSHTVGMNFFLFDEMGEGIILSDGIRVFDGSKHPTLSLLFQKAIGRDLSHTFIQKRLLLMEILCALAAQNSKQPIPDGIARALQYLDEHIEQNPTVAELAALCDISEVYFRRQFKAYVGLSPIEYRTALRLDRARSYLEYGDISVQEISDTLGYSTVSHFIEEFKKQYGISPLKYRKSSRTGRKA